MTGWRSPLARELDPDGSKGEAIARADAESLANWKEDALDAWFTLPEEVRQQALTEARRQREEHEQRMLDHYDQAYGEVPMTTIRTSTKSGMIGALKWKTTEISFGYDPKLVEALEDAKIPAEFREWDASKKVWRVRGIYYVDVFLRWARESGHEVLEGTEVVAFALRAGAKVDEGQIADALRGVA